MRRHCLIPLTLQPQAIFPGHLPGCRVITPFPLVQATALLHSAAAVQRCFPLSTGALSLPQGSQMLRSCQSLLGGRSRGSSHELHSKSWESRV